MAKKNKKKKVDEQEDYNKERLLDAHIAFCFEHVPAFEDRDWNVKAEGEDVIEAEVYTDDEDKYPYVYIISRLDGNAVRHEITEYKTNTTAGDTHVYNTQLSPNLG